MRRSEMSVDHGWAALVVVALYALLHGGQWARRTWRGKRHQRYATDRGLQFEPERREEWTRHASTSTLDLFLEGDRRRWGFTITGRYGGRTFTAFEYEWYPSTRREWPSRIRAVLWETPDAVFPKFSLTPKDLWTRGADWLLSWLARPDERALWAGTTSEFARVYVLAGDDAAAVGALFTPEIRAYFVAHLGHSLAGAQRELIWWRHGSLPVGTRLEAFLAEGDAIYRRFVRG